MLILNAVTKKKKKWFTAQEVHSGRFATCMGQQVISLRSDMFIISRDSCNKTELIPVLKEKLPLPPEEMLFLKYSCV